MYGPKNLFGGGEKRVMTDCKYKEPEGGFGCIFFIIMTILVVLSIAAIISEENQEKILKKLDEINLKIDSLEEQ